MLSQARTQLSQRVPSGGYDVACSPSDPSDRPSSACPPPDPGSRLVPITSDSGGIANRPLHPPSFGEGRGEAVGMPLAEEGFDGI